LTQLSVIDSLNVSRGSAPTLGSAPGRSRPCVGLTTLAPIA
jgi:hypothetical protein